MNLKKIDPVEESLGDKDQPLPKFSVYDGDGTYKDINWLENLGIFSVFLSKDKPRRTAGQPIEKTIDLREYHVINRKGRATRLLMKIPGSQPVKIWVDTLSFSLAMDKFEVLYEGNK